MSHSLYGSARWKKRRRAQLREHPLCVMCEAIGRITSATVADHATPHRGDPQLFWFGPLVSLCATHHSGTKQQQETRGYATDIGADGWPIDPNHAVYRKSLGGGGGVKKC
jgi:5-methylcytosine-specific restriction protein A